MVKITKEMLEKMSYDNEENVSEIINNLKVSPIYYECSVEIPKELTRESIIQLIRNHINELSAIESDQNCIPKYVAKKNIELGLKLAQTTAAQSQKTKTESLLRASSDVCLVAVIRAFVNVFQNVWTKTLVVVDDARKNFMEILIKKILKLPSNFVTLRSWEKSYSKSFSSMFILKQSDIDSAAYYLIESFNDPTAPWKIGYVYVQESCFEEFKMKIETKLKPYPKEIQRDQMFLTNYEKVTKIITKELSAQTIGPIKNETAYKYPIICHEFNREYFKTNDIDDDEFFLPVVILKVFRTVKEAISLATNDGAHVTSIWATNHSAAYEIAMNLNYSLFWINCFEVFDTDVPIKNGDLSIAKNSKEEKDFEKVYGKCGVFVKNSYHFEYFLSNNGEFFKTIIFPIGITFAN